MAKGKFERIQIGTPDVIQASTGTGELDLSEARMFGMLYEGILYGANVVLLLVLLRTFAKELKATAAQRLALAIVGIIFALCTVHLGATMCGLHIAFFSSGSDLTSPYLDRSQPVEQLQKALYAVATVFAEGMLIYRAVVLFGRKWIVAVLPVVSLVATLGLWVALIHQYANVNTAKGHAAQQLSTAAFAMSVATTGILTLLISAQLLSLRNTSFFSIAAQSGLFYTVVLLVSVVPFARGSNVFELLQGGICKVRSIRVTIQLRGEFSLYYAAVLGMIPILLALWLTLDIGASDRESKSTTGMRVTIDFNSHAAEYDVFGAQMKSKDAGVLAA
ncbi:hypothetical protein MSAN_02091900 [Mycena sanguinolenta]|uniref:Uncharacterized protein n=1 Tax=Mycena sanguinolenta TaxID=230812 RepID=A0A8H6XGI2_9AGAR|nr:hypothetical protein MSAN_02091900 [Mycena sanguinolenta]